MTIFPAQDFITFKVQPENLNISIISEEKNQILKKYSFDSTFNIYFKKSGDYSNNYIQF